MEKLITNFSNKKNNQFVIFIFCLYQIFIIQVNAQTVSINGRITSSRYAIKYASITFINNSDTTIKFTALTDASGNYQTNVVVTSIKPDKNLPTKFELEQNYPNPFSKSTAIPYQLKKESDIQVTIYDILGRVVRKFNVGQQYVGLHNVLWDGHNNLGQTVASGIYFYKLNADGESQVKKMVFNEGGKGFVSLTHSYSPAENTFLVKANKTQNVQENTFTIRVENTSTTLPVIVPEELQNVVIQNDTTINFSVDYLSTATIDFDSLHQIIRGFGASNIILWRQDMTNSEIQTAFGTGDGQLGFTILRIMVEPDSTRWALYIPTAKKAYDMGVTVIASPWYAPSNMTETVNNVSRVRHDMYSEYASHLNSFVKYMADNGVPIYGLSVQNEPDITSQWTSWTSDEILTFMKNNANVIEGTKVMAPESFHFDRSYSDPILNDSAASANTDIICGHIYGSGLASYPLAEEKGKEIWMTEYLINSDGNGPNMDTSWTAALQTAKSFNDCMNANMSAYVWWYIVRYYGPIGDGTYLRKGEVTKKGYVMSQFARYIRPGFHRAASSFYPPNNSLGISAYKDSASSKFVIVTVNNSTTQSEQVFRIQNGTTSTTFTPYTTSASKNCEQGDSFSATDGSYTFTLEPSSITTFVSN
jgi:glucuronoarabinoxylan endo-1,4-beta-xylanase